MKIRYISDIHLEFLSPKPQKLERICRAMLPAAADEILVLAGDIGNPRGAHYGPFLEFCAGAFKKVFLVAGNHEYYGSTIGETNAAIADIAAAVGVTFLNNSAELYDGFYFIGTTLWARITDPRAPEINDTAKIGVFSYLTCNRLNMLTRDFLEDAIASAPAPCVVITHHVPSLNLIDPKYKTPAIRPYNQWFYCDMDDFIKENKEKIAAWFYGHTHTAAETTVAGISFCCNPIGYPAENPRPDWRRHWSDSEVETRFPRAERSEI